jgi:uncharacterized protein YecE (DUF72 family)
VAAIAPLGPALGPVLVSLPHQDPDLTRLDRILAALAAAGGPPAAFELGPAWATSEVLNRMDAAGATLVASDTDERPSTAVPDVGPVAYVRLRRAVYSPDELDAWADRLAKAAADGRDAYAFLKHDDAATGPALASDLRGRIHG